MKKNLESLIHAAFAARKLAYAPYSKFTVGAAILSRQGSIYTGANVENASYGLAVCAERNAVMHAVQAQDVDWDTIAIVSSSQAPPCGMCLQVFVEFSDDLMVCLVSSENLLKYQMVTLKELLPFGFGKKDLSESTY